MARLVKFLEGGPHYRVIDYLYYDALAEGVMGPPSATSLTISGDNGTKLVIKGSFSIAGGVVTGGTATGFDLYAGSLKLAKAKGFAVDYADLKAALDEAQTYNSQKFEGLFFSGAKVKGSGGKDYLNGSDGAKVLGKAGNDFLSAEEGKVTLKGDEGNDLLFGNGFSKLFGGEGEDVFVVDPHMAGADAFKDFDVNEDLVAIERGLLASLPVGPLADDYFHAGKIGKASDAYVIYDKAGGGLYLDQDGAGSGAATMIATLPKHLKLTADNIFIGDFV
jgi:Ca2+-binding RTX toxin-like protein